MKKSLVAGFSSALFEMPGMIRALFKHGVPERKVLNLVYGCIALSLCVLFFGVAHFIFTM